MEQQAALSGERYGYAKRMLLGLEPPRADIPCTSCPIYRGTPHAQLPAAAEGAPAPQPPPVRETIVSP